MCGRYSLTGPNPAQLRERFGLGDELPIRARYNVAPTDEVVTVTTSEDGIPRGDLLRWGLVPHWAKDPRTGFKMINARAETVAEKPAYRDPLATRRCLIVADGFYEWQKREDAAGKQAFRITRADREPFAFAGLWAVWHGETEDQVLRTCTIITTRANGRLSPIHDRMPVVLPREAESAWLDRATPTPEVLELLQPLPDDAVDAREVGTAVNDVRNDTPECLEPPRPAAEAQTLF